MEVILKKKELQKRIRFSNISFNILTLKTKQEHGSLFTE